MAFDGAGVCQRNRSGARSISLPWVHGNQFLQYLEKPSCVPLADLEKYAGGKCVSGWFIEAPEKFDTPSPLAEFGLDRPPMSWQYVEIPDAAEE